MKWKADRAEANHQLSRGRIQGNIHKYRNVLRRIMTRHEQTSVKICIFKPFPPYGKVRVNQKIFGRHELLLKHQNCVVDII